MRLIEMRYLPVEAAEIGITWNDRRAMFPALKYQIALAQVQPGILERRAVTSDTIGRDDFCGPFPGSATIIGRLCEGERNQE